MKFFEDQLNKVRPLFAKGGKLHALWPIFEAQETFLFVKAARTESGAHIRDPMDTKRLMSIVILALLPTLLFGMYNAGYQHFRALGEAPAFWSCVGVGAWRVLPIVFVSYLFGGIAELIFCIVRKHEVNEGFLVTGMLFPLTLAPSTPLWIVAVAIVFGVVIGKEIYGGTGMNIFNPALTARALVFFAYPQVISGDRVWTILGGQTVDGYSGATPLLHAATHGTTTPVTQALAGFGTTPAGVQFADFSWWSMFIGLIPGSIGETSTLLCLVGAAVLIVTGIGSWRIMLGVVLGGLGMSLVMNATASSPASIAALPFHYHAVMGSFMFGLVYMATDPVSAAHTDTGKWLYGILIGVMVMIVRVVNPAFPEGMMLSILFMNAFAPLLDYFVVQRNIARRLARAQAV